MKKVKYTPEIRDRAVQLLIESEKDYPSNWAAITAIAPKIGCTPETLRIWYQKCLDKQTTRSRDDQKRADDLVKRNFTADHPDQLWVSDFSVPQQAA